MLAFVLTSLTTLAFLQWAAVRRGRECPATDLDFWIVESAPRGVPGSRAPLTIEERWADMLLEKSSFQATRGGALGDAPIGARMAARLAADGFRVSPQGQGRGPRPIVVPQEILEQVERAIDRRPVPHPPLAELDWDGAGGGADRPAATLH